MEKCCVSKIGWIYQDRFIQIDENTYFDFVSNETKTGCICWESKNLRVTGYPKNLDPEESKYLIGIHVGDILSVMKDQKKFDVLVYRTQGKILAKQVELRFDRIFKVCGDLEIDTDVEVLSVVARKHNTDNFYEVGDCVFVQTKQGIETGKIEEVDYLGKYTYLVQLNLPIWCFADNNNGDFVVIGKANSCECSENND